VPHARAAIISTGDELLLGQTLNTNSRWLADRLTSLGISVTEHLTLGDDQEALASALQRLCRSSQLVIITGGLGPTEDDLTRPALANVLDEELIEDPVALAHIEAWMKSAGRPMLPAQRTQALRPPSAHMLPNSAGTAPGLAARHKATGCHIFCLPGPPNEMQPMFETSVVPKLRALADSGKDGVSGHVILTRAIHTVGIAEADLAARLGPLMHRRTSPLVGTTASRGIVSCRIRAEGPADIARRQLAETEAQVRAAAGDFVFGQDQDSLAGVVLELLKQRNDRLVVAESCTGGGLAALLTEVPGASAVFLGGWITYANEMKMHELAVTREILDRHGAVSTQCAQAMAQGALRAARDVARPPGQLHALAVTGIAGPDGGSDAKPVGTVFIARATADPGAPMESAEIEVRRFLFRGGREAVRERSARMALAMLRLKLAGLRTERLLWEI